MSHAQIDKARRILASLGMPPAQQNERSALCLRRAFKTYAACHDLKLNELLFRCFDGYRAQQGD